jgi:hypothetical protein
VCFGAALHTQTPPSAAAPDAGAATSAIARSADTAVVRGLYVNRWASQSKNRMRALVRFARETGLNALVIDLKDEFGLNYRTADSASRRYSGTAGIIPDVRWLLDTLKASGLLPIARLVVFKDSVAARARPDWTIRAPDGKPWRDKQGLAWVSPYNRDLWEYNLRVAVEVARLGFGEIQFDYIRFPEPYRTLPRQVFPGSNGVEKREILAAFLREARSRLQPHAVRTTADVFGLITSLRDPLEIGQQWETLAAAADVLLPMVYPSHYPRGAFGIGRPNAAPYEIVKAAVSRAVERNRARGIRGEHVRPWIQAFSLGRPAYGNAEVTAQLRAVYESGVRGWLLWNPASRYEAFRAALLDDAARR